MIRRIWNATRAWLDRVPISDPVERRNAPFMQLVLMLFGTALPINLYYYLFVSGDAAKAPVVSAWLNAATDIAVVVAAWLGVWLIRRGRLRLAVALFLGTLLGSLMLVYLQTGLHGLGIDTTYPVLCLVIGGLVLGRKALWKVFAALLLTLALGVLSDLYRSSAAAQPAPFAPNWALNVLIVYVLITTVLDRTISALRDSLEDSARQSESLATANRLLRQEMIERERTQSQLIHAQKMEAVGRIASGITHDFDNVLNIVLGYATRRERIAEQGTPALVDALEGVELAARRALSISRKLLNFSRQDVSRLETFDAAGALRELLPMLRQLFDSDTQVLLDVGEVALPIRMDRDEFELVALSIAANARDAMPDGGRFSVNAYRADDDATVLQLSMSDNGCGMPESVLRRVFEPFFTTKPVGSGTGLGLAVVHDLIEASKGTITAQSAPGQGTTFRIRLPLARSN